MGLDSRISESCYRLSDRCFPESSKLLHIWLVRVGWCYAIALGA